MKNLIVEQSDQVRWYANMRDAFEATNIAPTPDGSQKARSESVLRNSLRLI